MLIRVVAVQAELGQQLTLEEKLHIFKRKPDFVCLPEYFMVGNAIPDFTRSALQIKENLDYIQRLSIELDTCLIGGSVVESDGDSLYNSSYLYNRGCKLGKYRKLNPVSGEIAKGILPGDKIYVRDVEGIRIGIMICADALNPGLFELMAVEQVDIIFIPTTSPLKPAESKSEKQKRDRDIYVNGASLANAFIVKTCAVGSLFSKPLQGRSLIAAPWGIENRVQFHEELDKAIISTVLDVGGLREFRRKKVFQDSKSLGTLYGDLTN